MAKIEEKRKYPRLSVYHLAKYRLVAEPQGPLVYAHIKDIGAGGACLCTEEKLPVSSVVDIYINFPGLNEPIKCQAKVVWDRQLGKAGRYESGLQFIDMEDAIRDRILEQVKTVTMEVEGKNQKKRF
jgi:c-di-GMP-binding flagellar brake protein YcgR